MLREVRAGENKRRGFSGISRLSVIARGKIVEGYCGVFFVWVVRVVLRGCLEMGGLPPVASNREIGW